MDFKRFFYETPRIQVLSESVWSHQLCETSLCAAPQFEECWLCYQHINLKTVSLEVKASISIKVTSPDVERMWQLVDGSNQLVDGCNQLVDGRNQLVNGCNQLVDGFHQSVDGCNKLVDDCNGNGNTCSL